jgi:hypothetical protein
MNTARLHFFIIICGGIVVLEFVILHKIIDVFR